MGNLALGPVIGPVIGLVIGWALKTSKITCIKKGNSI
jgi:uncharacterized membrane protein (Fun14 family)